MGTELENAEIPALTLQQLEKLTDHFSDKRRNGIGAFGMVYLGIQEDGAEVFVKVFRNKRVEMGTYKNVFDNELKSLMRLQHQNIVRLIAYCDHTERVFVEYLGNMVEADQTHRALCYEYVHNGSLQKHLSDEHQGLDWPIRYRIIKGTCEALEYLQCGPTDAHVIHLDINPENILLDKNMEPKLSGFNISMLISKEEDKLEFVTGKRGYMAPEYLDDGVVSNKSDIYSFGAVMLQIVAGPQVRIDSLDMPRQDFIDRVRNAISQVHANWRTRLQLTFRGSTLDAYCQQVKICTEIALHCLESDRDKRPKIQDITAKLNDTENHKGLEDLQKWKMSFNKLKTITNNFETEIGSGSFGVVYKGKLANGEVVAVKRLKPYSENPRKQIESEENLMNLEHENIVRLMGFCHETFQVTIPDEKNPDKYIEKDVIESLLCYEFLSNGNLEDKMFRDKSSRLDWQTSYSVIQGICKGLHYLHQGCQNAPIVHRDLKPANVLLDDCMVPKLGDFGLSRIVPKSEPHITMAFGSSGYMAPETLQDNKCSKITTKSDIYSLGVMILEIVTRERCSNGDPSGRHYIQKVREDRKQNSYIASKYPTLDDRFLQQVESWIRVGLRCVDELPERRPPTEHIIHFLETESANSVDTREGKVSKISFKELEDITNKFSEQYGESIFGYVYQGTRVNGDDIIMYKLKEQKRLCPGHFTSDDANLMSFEHKNILQLKGYCEEIDDDGEVRERLLCYEFFGDGSLGKKIYGDESLTQLDWRRRYEIIKGICQALKYLHEECEDGPQFHMSITPTDIWLDDEMVPKLGACGLSRLFATDHTQIFIKEIVESRGYVAPEFLELTKMSTKSDIYSLGVLIIEIVTRQKCPSSDDGSAASFIANVYKTWMKDLHVASKYPSLDAGGLQQVKGCIRVGVQCAEISPDKRPTAGEIILMLEKERTSKDGFCNALCSGICAKA